MSQVLLNGHPLSSQAVLDLLRRIAEFFNRDLVVMEANGLRIRFLVIGLQSAYVMMQLKLESLKSPTGWGIGHPQLGIRSKGCTREANRGMHVGGGCAPYIWTLAGGGLVIRESGGALLLECSGQSDFSHPTRS